MQLKEDKWYKMECKAARDQFIQRVIDRHSGVTIPDGAWDAQCLKYNSSTDSINYRRTYSEHWAGPMETYYMVNMMEEKKMEPGIKGELHINGQPAGAFFEHDEMVMTYYNNEVS